MELKIFSVFDVKAGAYAVPFFMSNKPMAIRAFSDNARSEDSIVCRNPEDFTLFEIGSFDDQSGKLETYENPIYLLRASDVNDGRIPEESGQSPKIGMVQ